jgi:rhodanese-related sulfurtransferase
MLQKLILFLAVLFAASPLHGGEVGIMDKDELKAKLGSDDLVIVDVRSGRDWSTSEFKIKDAVRIDGGSFGTLEGLPKDNTFVFYCA